MQLDAANFYLILQIGDGYCKLDIVIMEWYVLLWIVILVIVKIISN